MKVGISLAKNILAPLGIRAAASTIDIGMQKKSHASGATTLIISNKEMNDIMKILQVLEDSSILLKGVTKKNWKWKKNAKRRIFEYVIRYFEY